MNYLSKFSFFVLVCFFSLIQSLQASNHSRHNRIGGSGGEPSTTSCPQNMYAVGLRVKHNDHEIYSLQLLCRAVSGVTYRAVGRVESMPWTPVRSDRSLDVDEVLCNEGEGVLSPRVVGFTNNYLNIWPVVSGLKFRCVNFTPNPFSLMGVDKSFVDKREIGAKFDGRESFTGQGGDGLAGSGFKSIRIHSGGALDSIFISSRLLPWESGLSSRSFTPPARSIGRGTVTPTNNLPDYVVFRQIRNLYRTDKFGYVSKEFCTEKIGVRRVFDLPNISYLVGNLGNVVSPVTEVRIRVDNIERIPRETLDPINPSFNERRFIERDSVIERCVIKTQNSRCRECGGQKAYNDPIIEVMLDPRQLEMEDSEDNNSQRW